MKEIAIILIAIVAGLFADVVIMAMEVLAKMFDFIMVKCRKKEMKLPKRLTVMK